ncbi:hypothetical protein NIES4071_58570 [Calothrix sp. NIES-4071]|nr:hypothetical protein NIES4071_58570 [Calothrix sp. NIES-4071]BAZ60164.1 hypothetical protein NIES4105_58520 [Calothrix sp. NIES-4105]
MNNVKLSPIIVPLDDKARNLAQKFAFTATTPEEERRIYLNTLAVLAVNSFLVWMEIDTDLNEGESWNLVIRRFHNVADLVLPSLGTLECRPILPEETAISIPEEAREGRIGCVVVMICEESNNAQLMGCYTLQNQEDELPEQLQLQNLSPLEDLLDNLEWLDQLQARKELTNLRAFLVGITGSGWEKDTDDLTAKSNSKIRFRGAKTLEKNHKNHQEVIDTLIKQLHSDDEQCRQESAQKLGEVGIGKPDVVNALSRQLEVENHEETLWLVALSLSKIAPGHPKGAVSVRKLIDLGVAHLVALIISCRSDSEKSIRLWVQVRPDDDHMYLPIGCRLSILDESGQIFTIIEAQDKDDYIQKYFQIDLGDCFQVKVEVNNTSYTESFIC